MNMLKYYDIISKLSDSDKIYVLSDVNGLSDKKFRALGIPGISAGELASFCSSDFPTPVSLANSFDLTLVGEVADELVKKAEGREIGFLTVPAPRIKINPYRRAISEDTLLACKMSAEYLGAANRGGIAAAMDDFALYGDEVEWLDTEPSARDISELLVKPYMDVAMQGDIAALFTGEDLKDEKYGAVNSHLMNMVTEGEVASCAAVCKRVDPASTVDMLLKKGIFFKGSSQLLESALARYKKLKKAIEHGNATTEELNNDILRGRAISPEQIDEAVDRLLTLAFSVKRQANLSTVISDPKLSQRAIAASSVLLKNEGKLLPAKSGAGIAIIGDVAMEKELEGESLASLVGEGLEKRGFAVKKTVRGYNISTDRSTGLVGGALNAALDADIVLLFLGNDEKRSELAHTKRKLTLPANQLELLERLWENGKKTVAVLPSDRPFDVTALSACGAIIAMPFNTRESGELLCRFISGEEAPAGRLASTLYTDTDRRYTEHLTRKRRDGMKTGSFIGYRYYTSADIEVGFPFGHGLSYTHFSYSALSVKDGKVCFTVRNDGKRAGVEVAQVYAGLEGSSVIRPRRVLIGFEKLELGAGERRAVEIPLNLPEVYCAENKKYAVEAGEYTVEVGSSSEDIRLSTAVTQEGETIAPDKKRMSDHIYSVSNIISDNYKLEAKKKTMKKSIFNIAAGGVMLAMAIILKLYCASNAIHSGFLDVFSIIIAAVGIALFIAEAVRRAQISSEAKRIVEAESNEMFSDAEDIKVYDANGMFVREFDSSDEGDDDKDDEHIEQADAEYLKYIDKSHTFLAAASELETYAAERGLKLGGDTAKKIFAAMASSRLVTVSGMSDQSFNKLLLILSGYFETALYSDKVDASYTGGESVLFKTDASGTGTKTRAFSAIEAARAAAHSIHIAALTNVVGRDMPAYFASYIGYVKNPLSDHRVTVRGARGEDASYYIPKNLWFFVNLAEGEKADTLPDFVSEVATVNVFETGDCAPSEQTTHVKKFSYYQMDYLAERAASSFSVDEEIWKRIDHFEESVSSSAPFRIGNKLWLCLEGYVSTYIAAGGEVLDAIDEGSAAKLIVPAASALRDSADKEKRNLFDIVESVLGEDRAEACKKVIALCSIERA